MWATAGGARVKVKAPLSTAELNAAVDSRINTAVPPAVADAVAGEISGQDLLLAPQNATNVGKSSIDATDGLVVDVSTPWGIHFNGSPYYDDVAVTAGEEAVLTVTDDQFAWINIPA